MFLDQLGQMEGLFSPGGWVLALLLLAAGFPALLLFGGHRRSGGRQTGRPLFHQPALYRGVGGQLFLCALRRRYGFDGAPATGEDWMNWIPFTAILVTPSRLLLGQIPLWMGVCSLGLTVLCALALLWVSEKCTG